MFERNAYSFLSNVILRLYKGIYCMNKYFISLKKILYLFFSIVGTYYLLCFWIPIPLINIALKVLKFNRDTLEMFFWGVGMILTIIWICNILKIKMKNLVYNSLKALPKFKVIMLLILLGFLLRGTTELMSEGVSLLFIKSTQRFSEQYSNHIGSSIFILTIISVLFAPITEEFIFRFVIMNKLKGILSKTQSIIIVQALLFAIFHFNLALGSINFFTGIIYALVVLWTGNIISGMIVHCANNMLSIIIMYLNYKSFFCKYYYNISATVFYRYALILILIFFFVLLYFIYRASKQYKEHCS